MSSMSSVDSANMLKEAESMSRKTLERLLKSIQKAKKPKKQAIKKERVVFSLKINKKQYKQTIDGNEIIKEFMQDLIPNIGIMPLHAIKTQIVSLFEMLAEAEDCPSRAQSWRRKASKVVMLTNQKAMFSYITNIVTGIRMTAEGGYKNY